ncbi:MAG TPA: hypothetical protein VF883_21350 [Thermoanaerobaculia bacterium]
MTNLGARPGSSKLWMALAGCGAVLVISGAAVVMAVLMLWPSERGSSDAAPQVQGDVDRSQTENDDVSSAVDSSVRTPGAQSFAVGEKVEIEASNHWVPCVVSENQPPSIMRVQCEEYPSLSRAAGVYPVDRDNPSAVRHATGQTGPIAAAPPKRQQAAGPAGLKVAEYACYGSGGRPMAGLGFKVLSMNRYTDLEGDDTGSFSISGTTVTFRGGHLDGQTGRDLRGHSFTIARQAECEPF